MPALGRGLILAGALLVGLGVLLLIGGKLPRLPGDIVWRGKNTVVYFPLMTCLILSVVLSLVLWWIGRR